MKKVAGFSPLQVLGLLVFGFAIMSNLRKRIRTKKMTLVFHVFLFLLFFNLLLILVYEQSLKQFGDTIRTLLPFALFFYFRKHLNTKLDLEGFLITFLIASIFPIATFIL